MAIIAFFMDYVKIKVNYTISYGFHGMKQNTAERREHDKAEPYTDNYDYCHLHSPGAVQEYIHEAADYLKYSANEYDADIDG